MISTIAKQILAWALSCLLVIAAGSFEVAGQQPAPFPKAECESFGGNSDAGR